MTGGTPKLWAPPEFLYARKGGKEEEYKAKITPTRIAEWVFFLIFLGVLTPSSLRLDKYVQHKLIAGY